MPVVSILHRKDGIDSDEMFVYIPGWRVSVGNLLKYVADEDRNRFEAWYQYAPSWIPTLIEPKDGVNWEITWPVVIGVIGQSFAKGGLKVYEGERQHLSLDDMLEMPPAAPIRIEGWIGTWTDILVNCIPGMEVEGGFAAYVTIHRFLDDRPMPFSDDGYADPFKYLPDHPLASYHDTISALVRDAMNPGSGDGTTRYFEEHIHSAQGWSAAREQALVQPGFAVAAAFERLAYYDRMDSITPVVPRIPKQIISRARATVLHLANSIDPGGCRIEFAQLILILREFLRMKPNEWKARFKCMKTLIASTPRDGVAPEPLVETLVAFRSRLNDDPELRYTWHSLFPDVDALTACGNEFGLVPVEYWIEMVLQDLNKEAESQPAWREIIQLLARQPDAFTGGNAAIERLTATINSLEFRDRIVRWLSCVGLDRIVYPDNSEGLDTARVNGLPQNETLLLNLIDLTPRFLHDECADVVHNLAIRCYKDAPYRGRYNKKAASRCLPILAHGEREVARKRLIEIRNAFVRTKLIFEIDRLLKPLTPDKGKSKEEFKELAIATFDLSPDGRREVPIGDVTAVLEVTDGPDLQIAWQDASGKRLKTKPNRLLKNPTSCLISV